ncbi:MAG: hypothetical protein QXH80_04850 [Candidatus Nanoarchaeia archaeon]
MKEKNKKNQTKKYNFKTSAYIGEKTLFCPQCLEMIMRDDIEHFYRCPFCNYQLEANVEIEDYILGPYIEQWMYKTGAIIPPPAKSSYRPTE